MSETSPPEPSDAVLSRWFTEREQLGESAFAPQEFLTLREWAEKHRRWPDETPYRVEQTPHIGEILDAYSDPGVEEIVVMKPTQSGLTEGLLLNAVGYHIDRDPRVILVVIPSVEEAEKWSVKKLQPMIDATPTIQGKLKNRIGRSDSMLEKGFPGGSIGIVGANSALGFRMVTVGAVLSDDVDGWSDTAGKAGDQVPLIRRRADRVPDRKLVWISSPEFSHGRINRMYRSASRVGRFHVPCPSCGAFQVLRWGFEADGKELPYGVKWEREEVGDDYEVQPGEIRRGRTVHRPNTAYYLCAVNACAIDEAEKPAMEAAGVFLTEDGEQVRAKGFRSLGYWFNALTITLPGSEWPRLIGEYLEGLDTGLQGFWNTILAEPWEDRTEKVVVSLLEKRARKYVGRGGELVEVPDGVGLLTAGVDVQALGWLELLVGGWGIGDEWWDVFHERISGDVEKADVWQRLDALLLRKFKHENGGTLQIARTMIDAAYATKTVYEFVRPREERGVFAAQGAKTSDPKEQPLSAPVKSNAAGVMRYTTGGYKMKSDLFRRLQVQEPGPRYMHLRAYTPELCNGFDAEYFTQFGAEEKRFKRVKGSLQVKPVYEQIRERNEAIDLHVLNMAALQSLGAAVPLMMPQWVAAASKGASGAPPARRRVVSKVR